MSPLQINPNRLHLPLLPTLDFQDAGDGINALGNSSFVLAEPLLTPPPDPKMQDAASAPNRLAGLGNLLQTSDHIPGQSNISPGKIFTGSQGSYEIVKEIGSGGFGDVFLANVKDPRIAMPDQLAVKVFNYQGANMVTALERFKRELKILQSIEHKNIVKVFDNGVTEDGKPFIGMEYINGKSLQKKLDEGARIPIDQIVKIAMDVCDALDYLHTKTYTQIVHRDVKPANIMVTQDKKTFLMDVGIAKCEEESTLTRSGDVQPGTAFFMAPEQLQPNSKVDSRSDLFSLGATLYVLSTGQLPFKSSDNNFFVLSHIINTHPPTEPRELNSEIPLQFSTLIIDLLEKNPTKRGEKFKNEGALGVRKQLAIIHSFTRPRSGPRPRSSEAA